jgi:hypothetical protein
VRDEIRKTLIQQGAAALALEAMHSVVGEIRQMKKAPDLGIVADGKKIRHVVVPGLQTEEELAAMAGLGKAARDTAKLPADALAVTELVGEAKAKVAVGEISEPYPGADGESYAFRITAVQANHEPASLDEVRPAVLADVRKIRAFEIAREKARKIFEEAPVKGLEAAAKDQGVTTVESDWFPEEHLIPVPSAGQFLSLPATLPEIGANRAAVAECFRAAAEKKPFVLITLAEQQTAVVAGILGQRPPREALFERMRPILAQEVGFRLGGTALREALNLESIRSRMDVVVLQESDEFRPPRGIREYDDTGDGF